jgi:hypothetical protein
MNEGDRIMLDLTIATGKGAILEKVFGFFVSLNELSETNPTIDSMTVDRVLNVAEVIRNKEEPIIHRQTFYRRNYYSMGQGIW